MAWLSIRCPILLAGVGGRFHLFRRQTVIAQDQSPLRGCSHLHPKVKERGTIKQMLNHESSHTSSLLKSEGALSHPLSRPTAALSTLLHNSGAVQHSELPQTPLALASPGSKACLQLAHRYHSFRVDLA